MAPLGCARREKSSHGGAVSAVEGAVDGGAADDGEGELGAFHFDRGTGLRIKTSSTSTSSSSRVAFSIRLSNFWSESWSLRSSDENETSFTFEDEEAEW